MARISSATERGTLARAAALSGAQRILASHLIFIGKGDLSRGLCVVFAAFLTAAGLAAPHIELKSLAAILFFASAALALFVGTAPSDADTCIYENVKGAQNAPPGNAVCAAREGAMRNLAELTARKTRPHGDLAAWARLTNRMSHELRTPLNAVLGFSELMSNEVFGPLGSSRYCDYARDIHVSGRQLLKSAEDALAITALLTAPERNDIQATSAPARAIDDAIAFHESEISARAITVSVADLTGADVVAEAHTLRQIMVNLMAEALAITADGGRLDFTARNRDGRIEVSLEVGQRRQGEPAIDDSFALLLARTLVELSDARFYEIPMKGPGWEASMTFLRADQADFFAPARIGT